LENISLISISYFQRLCELEGLISTFGGLGKNTQYDFNNRRPSRGELIAQLDTPPSILQRVAVAERLLVKIMDVVEMFEDELEE